MFDAPDGGGNEVAMFWQAASYDGNALPAPVTLDQTRPEFYKTHIEKRFPKTGGIAGPPVDRVTMRLKLQPIGADVLDDLVTTGDLEAPVAASMPTLGFPASGSIDWTPSTADAGFIDPNTLIGWSCLSKTNLKVGGTTVPA